MEKNLLVSIKAADLAKELGFSEPVLYYYDGCDMIASQAKNVFDYKNYNSHRGSTLRSAPTQALLQKWLKDTHDLFIKIDFFLDENDNLCYDYCIASLLNPFNKDNISTDYVIDYSLDREYKTPEECLNEALYEALLLIKNKTI